MRLPQFNYLRPKNLQEAGDYLEVNSGETRLVSGGTDLLVRMKQGLTKPVAVVSLREVAELQGIVETPGAEIRLGASVTLDDIIKSPLIKSKLPGLAEAASLVGARQHQVMGTIGGNLVLDTRCWYYNQTEQWRKSLETCLKLGGQKCHVASNKKDCSASFAGDTAPILIALDAVVRLVSKAGERTIPLQQFYTGQGEKPNCLEPGELLAEIIIPPVKEGIFARYLKLRSRESIEFAQAGVAVKYLLDEKQSIREVRIVVNAIAPAPFRAVEAERMLEGNLVSQELIAAAAEQVHAVTRPLPNMPGSIWYRRFMVQKFTKELLLAAVGTQQLVI